MGRAVLFACRCGENLRGGTTHGVVPYRGFSEEGTIEDCSVVVDSGMGGNRNVGRAVLRFCTVMVFVFFVLHIL